MKKLLTITFIISFLFSCQQNEEENISPRIQSSFDLEKMQVRLPFDSELNQKINQFSSTKSQSNARVAGQSLEEYISSVNESIAKYGLQFEKAEFLSAEGAGRTVFFSDRGNKQLDSDYVPNDPRNLGGTSVPYIVDGTQIITASGLNTLSAIDNVMNTWESVTCSGGLDLPSAGVSEDDIGFVSNFFFDFGGSTGFFPGVIVHAGVLPPAFFNELAPGGGNGILGVCFTLVWTEDINQDGKGDVAIKEIYYNDNFDWQDVVETGSGVDFETVALHETGHALSQAHFGEVSRTESNGKVHFSPRALMNAGYSGVNRVVAKTDKAGHCSNWGNWPNN